MSYGEYVDQLSCLLFLKIADERSRPPWSQPERLQSQLICDILTKR